MRVAFTVPLALSVALSSGCVSAPRQTAEADVKTAPKERTVGFQSPVAGPHGILVVTRDDGLVGRACYYALSFNGTLAARLDEHERARFEVPAGEIVMKAGRDPMGQGFCGMDSYVFTQRETIIRDGETKKFRFVIGVDGMPDIQRASD